MKILLDIHHGIGDMAMFLCVLRTLIERMPCNEIHMLVKSPVEQQLAELVGGVKKFYYFHPLDHTVWSDISLIRKLRKEKYDVGIVHMGVNANLGALLMKVIGCKISIGEKKEHVHFNYDIPINIPNDVFRSERNTYLLEGLGLEKADGFNVLEGIALNTGIGKEIRERKERYNAVACLCTGTGSTLVNNQMINAKAWGDNKWLELIEQLTNKNIGIILLGGQKEKENRSPEFEMLSDEHIIDLTGKVDLVGSIEAIQNSDILIAADTGLSFCSALMNKPTLSLLGPSSPQLSLPCGKKVEYFYLTLDCSPCYGTERMAQCKDRKCMNNITVDMVCKKVLEMIQTEKITDREPFGKD